MFDDEKEEAKVFQISFYRIIFYGILIGSGFIPIYSSISEAGIWILFGIMTGLLLISNGCVSTKEERSSSCRGIIGMFIIFIIYASYVQFAEYFMYHLSNTALNPPVIIAEIFGALIFYDILTGIISIFVGGNKGYIILYAVFIVLNWIGYIIFNVCLSQWGITAIFAGVFSYCFITRMICAFGMDNKVDHSSVYLTAKFLYSQFWVAHLIYALVVLIVCFVCCSLCALCCVGVSAKFSSDRSSSVNFQSFLP